MKHLIKLARQSDTVEAFIDKALRFPKWYGYPGRGTRDDYHAFFNMVKAYKGGK